MRCIINLQDTVSESLDGEVVVVNLKTGRYYSLVDTASQVWSHIESGRVASEIELDLQQQFRDPDNLIGSSLTRFLQELADEGLVQLEGEVSPLSMQTGRADSDAPPFRTPVLNKHVDMEGLLLLDPIHDVSEQGWPEKKA